MSHIRPPVGATSVAIAGWEEVGDASGRASIADVGDRPARAYPDELPGRVDNWKHQPWRFITMETGDLAAMPRKFLGVVAIGRLTGGYEYRSEAQPPASGTRARWSGCAPGSSGPRSVATYATAEDDACWARPGRPYERDDLVRQITLRPTGGRHIQRFHCLLGLRRPPLRKQQHADVVPQFHCFFARVAVNSAYDVQHFSQLRQRVGDPRERRAWSSAFRPQARIRAGSHAGQCQHGRLLTLKSSCRRG